MSDLIDRQSVIDKITERQRKLIYCFGFENDLVKIMNIAKSIIIAMPSAQPEPLTLRVNNELTKEEYDKLMQDIKDAPIVLLPSVQPEPSQVARDIATIIENEQDMMVIERNAQQWIPCSERLPEDYEEVLVWFEYFRYGVYNRLYQTHGIGDYSSEYDSWMINHESGWSKLRVIAWMPLPEPWKEGEADG